MINVKALRYSYQNLDFLYDFCVQKGELVSITGPSGAGKSTLLSLLCGFCEPVSGEIYLNNELVNGLEPSKRPLSMLFQENNLFAHLSVRDNLSLAFSPRYFWQKQSESESEAILNMSKKLQINELLLRMPEQISTGQAQRVALARALLRKRPILLLDEPFASQDRALASSLLELLKELAKEHELTVLMVTHSEEDASFFAQRRLHVDKGSLREL